MDKMKTAAALSYEEGKDNAPKVVARGQGHIAEKIIKLAEENHIPLFQNEETAQLLNKLPLGVEIPPELYQAVAEIYAILLRVGYEGSKGRELKENT